MLLFMLFGLRPHRVTRHALNIPMKIITQLSKTEFLDIQSLFCQIKAWTSDIYLLMLYLFIY